MGISKGQCWWQGPRWSDDPQFWRSKHSGQDGNWKRAVTIISENMARGTLGALPPSGLLLGSHCLRPSEARGRGAPSSPPRVGAGKVSLLFFLLDDILNEKTCSSHPPSTKRALGLDPVLAVH